MESKIQHWLVTVARAADLEGAGDLTIGSEVATPVAWDLVTSRTGATDAGLARAVADHFRLNVADLKAVDPQAHRLMPGVVARKLCILPLSYTDRNLVVATPDPVSLLAERSIGEVSDRRVVYRVAPPDRIRAAIEETYDWDEGPVARSTEEEPDAGGPRVLVVDDDADTRLLLRTVLERHDYRVVEADDGPAALRALEEPGPVDFMTLDLQMEEMDGLEVLREVRSREETRRLPVIVATGSDDPEVEIRLFEEGADDFIVKPLDPRRFILRLEAVRRRLGEDPGPDGGAA